MDNPTEINSVYWDEDTKSWKYKMIKVEEYHGFVQCQYCHQPISHNIKTDGEFEINADALEVEFLTNGYCTLFLPKID